MMQNNRKKLIILTHWFLIHSLKQNKLINYHHNEKETYSEKDRKIGNVEFNVVHLFAAADQYKVPFPNGAL